MFLPHFSEPQTVHSASRQVTRRVSIHCSQQAADGLATRGLRRPASTPGRAKLCAAACKLLLRERTKALAVGEEPTRRDVETERTPALAEQSPVGGLEGAARHQLLRGH